jgi:hypothetical protein
MLPSILPYRLALGGSNKRRVFVVLHIGGSPKRPGLDSPLSLSQPFTIWLTIKETDHP